MCLKMPRTVGTPKPFCLLIYNILVYILIFTLDINSEVMCILLGCGIIVENDEFDWIICLQVEYTTEHHALNHGS